MTPEEVRAEAIELIARDRFARGAGAGGASWDELPEWAATYLEQAAHDIAVIDHLLPTGRETRTIVHDPTTEGHYATVDESNSFNGRWIGFAGMYREEGGRVEHQCRWTHDWIEAPDA